MNGEEIRREIQLKVEEISGFFVNMIDSVQNFESFSTCENQHVGTVFLLLYSPKLPNKRQEVYLDPRKHISKTQGRLIPLLTIDEDTRGAVPFKTPVDIFSNWLTWR